MAQHSLVMAALSLLRPSPDLMEAAEAEFDRDNSLDEEALRCLFRSFPNNSDPAHVLLKVVTLNELYKARIRSIDIRRISLHIASSGVDMLLARGSPEAAERILSCPGVLRYFSFASKYCSWHNQSAYPIYDSNVDEALWWYRKHDGFTVYNRDNYDYGGFVRIVNAFKTFYGLSSFTYKQLDKFLLRQGYELNAPCACGSGKAFKSCHAKLSG